MLTEAAPLVLDGLHERHSGLTEGLGRSFGEAASVCFSRHHTPPVVVVVNHDMGYESRVVDFTSPDGRTRNAHANEIDATEAGAYGVSLAAVEVIVGLVAVRRAETLTGADWYVAPPGTDAEDLEDCIRLEISGTNLGTSSHLKRLLQEKVDQTDRGLSNLPAMAAVVGFKALEIGLSPIRSNQ